MKYNPKIWGPHYWFFLFSIALTYPHNPTNITKKKYYNLIRDFPLFIPDYKIGKSFEKLINKYPVSPYLDNRNSFIRWINFIHNQINISIKKPKLSLQESLYNYYLHYIPEKKPFFSKDKIIYISLILIFLLIILYLYQI
tara:strand:+ start:108 stop:527 length:420 start_codon:yes stop_codon:yes gene_type:complete